MKKILGSIALTALAISLLAAEKKKEEPFYRRYLVAGHRLDDRIKEQEKRVDADPNSADLRNDFGNLLAARRFPKEAREQYRLAMKLDKKHYLAPYNLGMLYETQGEFSHAISAYESSVDRNRGFPPARFRLARLYEKRGSNDRAVEQYARALQIDPSMRDPRRNPLILDSRLLDRVSLENYPRDYGVASMASDAAYLDQRLGRLPLDRALSSEDVSDAQSGPETLPAGAPPAVVAPAKAAPTPGPMVIGAPASIAPGSPRPIPTPAPPH